MNNDIQTRNRGFTLKGWHIALAVFLVLVVLVCLYSVVCRNKVEDRVRALHAAGYPTNLAELAEYTKLPEGVRNAADLYVQAFAAYVPPVDEANVPAPGQGKWPDRGVALPEPMACAIADCLAANQKCLDLLHEAAGIEHCRYDVDETLLITPVQEYRYCGQLLHMAAVYHAFKGETEATIACLQDELRLSDSLQRQPALIGHLVRISFIAMTIGSLERSLSFTAFTDAQLKELRDKLGRIGGTLDFTQALVTERCFTIEICRNPARFAQSSPTPPMRIFPGFQTTCLTDTLDIMARCIEAAQQPPRERLARFRQIENEIKQLSFLHMMTKLLTPAMTHVVELDLRIRAHLDLAQTALAIERYRLATGKVPGQLGELVPQYLERVPIDPFDGQPLRYHPGAPGYVLYSIAEDGQDNGGRERSGQNRNGPFDLCFIVAR